MLLLTELSEMIGVMENSCLNSIPEEAGEEAKTWTTIGVAAAFSAIRQTFMYVQATLAKGMEKNEFN